MEWKELINSVCIDRYSVFTIRCVQRLAAQLFVSFLVHLLSGQLLLYLCTASVV